MYCSPNIFKAIKSRKFIWADHVARLKDGRSAFKILTGNPTGNRPLGRPIHSWEDNIGMDIKTIVINTRNWIYSAQDRDYWKGLKKTLDLWVP